MFHSLFCQVVDMALALEAVSLLEKTPVTKEALEVGLQLILVFRYESS